MNQKLDLLVGKGSNYSSNTFSMKISVKNFDSASIALNKLKVIAYGWLPYYTFDSTQILTGVTSVGTISQFSSTPSGTIQSGIISLNTANNVYTITHNPIDFTKIAPNVSLIVPNGGSQISPISLSNRTSISFDVVLDSPPPTTGYQISWSIPAGFDVPGGYQIVASNPTISFTKLQQPLISNKIADTKIEITWPLDTNSLPTNYMLTDCEVYITDILGQINLDSWYTQLDDIVISNATTTLNYNNGTSWEIVQEYVDSFNLDGLTGKEPTQDDFFEIDNPGTSKSVYISQNNPNPLASLSPDKDYLTIFSNGTGDVRRGLIKFDPSTLSSFINQSNKAILRLNITSAVGMSNLQSSNGLALYKMSRDWNEVEATFTKYNSTSNWTTVGGDFYSSPKIWYSKDAVDITTSQLYAEFEISDYVTSWLQNPSTNYGLMIKLLDDSTSTPIKIVIDGFDTVNHPLLYSNYTTISNAIPTISHSIPSSYITSSSFNISATSTITSGSVNSVSVYYYTYGSVEKILLGSLNNNSPWSNTFTSLTPGDYTFVLEGVSDKGVIGKSEMFDITFIPDIFFSVTNSPLYTSTNIANIQATVFESTRFKNQEISVNFGFGTSVGDVSNGVISLAIPTGTIDTASYNLTAVFTEYGISQPFSFQVYKQSVTISQNLTIAKDLDGVTNLDVYYVPTSFSLSANVVSVSPKVQYYETILLNGSYIKTNLLAQPTSSPYTANITLEPSSNETTSSLRYVTVVVNDKDIGVIKLYVKNPTPPEIKLLNNTSSNPISFGGKLLDYDVDNGIVFYSVTGGLYENNINVDNISLYSDEWEAEQTNPATSATYFEVRTNDNYNFIKQNTYALQGVIQLGPFVNTLSLTNSAYDVSPYFITSATPTISAYTNLIDIQQNYFNVFDGSNTYQIAMRYDNTAILNLESNKTYSISACFKTNGGYENIKTISTIYEPGPTISFNLPSCQSCYCNNTHMTITGNLLSSQNKTLYTNLGITYTNVSKIYDNFNNIIGTISFDGIYTFTWNPVIGVDTLRLEQTDSFGILWKVYKPLPTTIQNAPTLIILSPK